MARFRIEAGNKAEFTDPVGEKVRRDILADLGFDPGEVRTVRVLTLLGDFQPDEAELTAKKLFQDPVIENMAINPEAPLVKEPFTYAAEVTFLPGVTDNVARSAREGIELLLNRELKDEDYIFSSTLYYLHINKDEKEVRHIAEQVLYNPLIERLELLPEKTIRSGTGFSPPEAPPHFETPPVETIHLETLSDEQLFALSKDRGLALTLEEMQAIRDHHADPTVKIARSKSGLPDDPTDVELEAYAQTWSEHCKHKIFAAEVDYMEEDSASPEQIRSLFKTMIAAPTAEIMKKRKDIASVFKDNAGVFHFDEKWDICVKAETHNSPSALEPYGGAMTGIVGVNRDILGTGKGFFPVFNTDVFCFGPPDYNKELPERLHHPKRLLRGVHRGVKDGGNQSGIPTVNGSISFDDRYLGKPLVFCGTGGIAPRNINGKNSFDKEILPGDKAVMVGGHIGKDGIHGATFSSEGLSMASPTSAVQIGDPITQKRMIDFLIVARDRDLYRFVTDNGAGGLSSSMGEMATECGGLDIDLALAPLKYPGLAPWEIFLSEAQERMSLAVPADKLEEFLNLAKKMRVTACCMGEFNDSGALTLRYDKKVVGRMDMNFLHDGLPTLKLKATWNPKTEVEPTDDELPPHSEELAKRVLSRFNVCSKEDWVRQYDHEVQGMSVIKPFAGVKRDAPSDAAVLRPDISSWRGIAVSHGLLPRYSDIDAYQMAMNVMDEALRSLVCVGADPDTALGLDNFCWPDPQPSPSNPQAEHKMAQLVRACKGLRDGVLATGMACISGKDSMKNDYVNGNLRISIPPTLLFTATAVVPDVRKSVSMDFKEAGDEVFLLGETMDELGASELYTELGRLGSRVPVVNFSKNMPRYRALHQLIQKGVIRSAHDLSEGGLMTALAECCFGGRCGAEIVLPGTLSPVRYLYSESAGRILISVSPDDAHLIRETFQSDAVPLGRVAESPVLTVGGVSLSVDALFESWRNPLRSRK